METRYPEAARPAVLVVEDDAATREALKAVLRSADYDVTCASNGRDALDALRSGLDPIVILLDRTMPIMDGWEFRAEQLKDAHLRTIPVIVVTWATMRREVTQHALQGVHLVRKPPSSADILKAVARYAPWFDPATRRH